MFGRYFSMALSSTSNAKQRSLRMHLSAWVCGCGLFPFVKMNKSIYCVCVARVLRIKFSTVMISNGLLWIQKENVFFWSTCQTYGNSLFISRGCIECNVILHIHSECNATANDSEKRYSQNQAKSISVWRKIEFNRFYGILLIVSQLAFDVTRIQIFPWCTDCKRNKLCCEYGNYVSSSRIRVRLSESSAFNLFALPNK